MKKLTLFFSELKDTWMSTIALFIVMTLAMFLLTTSYASYRFVTYTYEKTSSANLENAVYFMGQYGSQDYKSYMNTINHIKKYDAVKNVYYHKQFNANFRENITSITICPEIMRKLYPSLLRGAWFDNPVNEDGSLNAIIVEDDVKIGDVLDVQLLSSDETVKVRVCGTLPASSSTPSFGTQGTHIRTIDMYLPSSLIIVGDSEWTEKLSTESLNWFSASDNCIIEFKDEASAESIEECKEYLYSVGGFLEMKDVFQYSREWIEAEFKSSMIRPIFFVFIAFIAFVSISILTIYKKIGTRATYYLVGCSKRKLTLDILQQVGVLSFLSGGLNLLFAFNAGKLSQMGIFDVTFMLFDRQVIGVIALTVLAIYVFTSLVCLLVMNKKTPLDMIREFEQ